MIDFACDSPFTKTDFIKFIFINYINTYIYVCIYITPPYVFTSDNKRKGKTQGKHQAGEEQLYDDDEKKYSE